MYHVLVNGVVMYSTRLYRAALVMAQSMFEQDRGSVSIRGDFGFEIML